MRLSRFRSVQGQGVRRASPVDNTAVTQILDPHLLPRPNFILCFAISSSHGPFWLPRKHSSLVLVLIAVYIVAYWLLSLTALSAKTRTQAFIGVLTACLLVICSSRTLIACMLLLRTFMMFYFIGLPFDCTACLLLNWKRGWAAMHRL